MKVKNAIESKISNKQIILVFAIAFAIYGVLLFLVRAKAGLKLFEFGDETEKFVAAQMIQNGMRLYLDIFAHHGPVPYIVSHAYVTLVDSSDFSHIRWFMVGLALLSSLSIYASPIFKNTTTQLFSIGLFLALLSSIWVLQGTHMILYNQIGGLLFIIPITQLFLPLLYGHRPTILGLACTGFSLVVICFTAYAFGPSVLFIVLSALILSTIVVGNTDALKQTLPVFYGAAVAILAIFAWFLFNADLKGFFVYHFYFNQEVYSKFIGFDLRALKNLFLIDFSPQSIVHTFVLLGLLSSLFLALKIETPIAFKINKKLSAFSVVLFFMSLIMLSPRGETGLHGAGFVVAGLAVFSVLSGLYIQKTISNFNARTISLVVFGLIIAVFIFEKASDNAVSSPHGVRKSDLGNHISVQRPGENFGLIEEIATHDKDLLALIFNPSVYIKAGKLPASGHYYYLPWQAAYNKDPVDGYRIDICEDLKFYRPSLIWFDNWKVWDKYSVSDYEPCIPEIINANYSPLINGSPIFIRSDRLVHDNANLGFEGGKMTPSHPLDESYPIKLKIFSARKISNNYLKRLGIMFGTYVRHNPGKAELVLSTREGKIYRQDFTLPDLADNQYKYFDVPSDDYTAGEIRSVSGGGVSTWEIHSADGHILTCINYLYSDNKIAVTPGCPQ